MFILVVGVGLVGWSLGRQSKVWVIYDAEKLKVYDNMRWYRSIRNAKRDIDYYIKINNYREDRFKPACLLFKSTMRNYFDCTPQQYHTGLDKLWDALKKAGIPTDYKLLDGKDVFTLAAENIRHNMMI